MSEHSFRREAFRAWLLPVGLFLILPCLLVVTVSGANRTFESFLFLLFLVAPIAMIGYLLAPWAGRSVPTSKAPAFIFSALAAVSPMAVPLAASALDGSLSLYSTTALAWAFLALPASVVGALLFIGACERRLQ